MARLIACVPQAQDLQVPAKSDLYAPKLTVVLLNTLCPDFRRHLDILREKEAQQCQTFSSPHKTIRLKIGSNPLPCHPITFKHS